jgi:F-type H+-transporting ATPase subunit epsilon
MTLRVHLPFQIFLEKTRVTRLVTETIAGYYGFLPRRLDCVAALTPGLLFFETDAEGDAYLAIDEGVLVKTGPDVRVSVRRAFSGTDLGQLRQIVVREYLALDEHEQNVRRVMMKLETGLIRRLVNFQHDEQT